MNLSDQFSLEHLLFSERKCKKCGEVKNLLEDFYLSRKHKGSCPSSYSYECKICTIKRIKYNRQCKNSEIQNYNYPDW